MPRTRPSRLVRAGERSRERERPRRNGPRRSASGGAGSRRSSRRSAAPNARRAVVFSLVSWANHRSRLRPHVAHPQAAPAASAGHVVGRRRAPTGTDRCTGRRSAASPDPTSSRLPARAPRPGPRRRAAAGRRQRRSSAVGIAADADVAVGQQDRPPPALRGSGAKTIPPQRGAPRAGGPAGPPRPRRRCRARRAGRAPVYQRGGQPARPAADVEGGPAAAAQQRPSPARSSLDPGAGVDRDRGAGRLHQVQQAALPRAARRRAEPRGAARPSP